MTQLGLTPPVMSKLPIGLLGFLGIKNGGQYPQTLGNVLLPQIELLDMIASNYRVPSIFVSNPVAIGFTPQTLNAVAVVVPPGELWYLMSASVSVFTGVGDSITCSSVIRSPQTASAGTSNRVMSPIITQAANLSTHHPGILVGGRWLCPGDAMNTHVSAIVSATGNITVTFHTHLAVFPY